MRESPPFAEVPWDGIVEALRQGGIEDPLAVELRTKWMDGQMELCDGIRDPVEHEKALYHVNIEGVRMFIEAGVFPAALEAIGLLWYATNSRWDALEAEGRTDLLESMLRPVNRAIREEARKVFNFGREADGMAKQVSEEELTAWLHALARAAERQVSYGGS